MKLKSRHSIIDSDAPAKPTWRDKCALASIDVAFAMLKAQQCEYSVPSPRQVAERAWAIADAMIEQRDE